jgi:hypothetical protein
VVVPAAALIYRVAEQFAWSLAGQPQALAAQVGVVGVPDLGREVGHPAARRHRLSQREVALEAQRPLPALASRPPPLGATALTSASAG